MRFRKVVSVSVFLASMSLIVAGCPKSCQKVVTKEEYVKEMDQRCAEFEKRLNKDSEKIQELMSSNPQEATVVFEKMIVDTKKENSAMEAMARPKDVETLIADYFALSPAGYMLLSRTLAVLKKQVALSSMTEEEMAAASQSITAEMANIQKETIALGRKTSDLAKKIGFAICGMQLQEEMMDEGVDEDFDIDADAE